MKELEFRCSGLQELKQTELKELHGGNPIIEFIWDFIKSTAWNYVFSPTNGSQSVHPSAPRNPDGMYICVSDNA